MFQQVFSAIGNRTSNPMQRHLPMINSVTTSASGFMYEVNQIRRKKKLMSWFKTIPELTAFVNKVAMDVTSKWHFEPVNKSNKSRNKILRANKFSLQVVLRDIMYQQMVDALITGEGYGWIGKLTDKQLKENIIKAYNKTLPDNIKIELKEVENKYIEILFNELKEIEHKITQDIGSTDKVDEDLLIPRKYRYVPSTTIENIHDEYDFIKYSHIVAGRQVIFNPDEIVRYTLMNVDGKPNGFTPVESVLVQLELLRFMWLNMLSIQKNGGMPDKMIIAKDLDPNTPAFKRLEETLMKYKLVENKHGNMLFTGDIDIKDIQAIEDMQFKDLGLYITGLVAMQWGISKDAIPFIVGGTNTKSDVGGGANDNYFSVVEFFQGTFAQDMNTQLWIPYFGVKIVFDSPNVQRQIRIETANMNKFNNLLTMDNILMKVGKQLNTENRLTVLGLDESDIEDVIVEEPTVNAAVGIGTQNEPSKDPKTIGQENISKRKRDEQIAISDQRGKKPDGVTKEQTKEPEWTKEADIELKQMIGSMPEVVDIDTFIKIYQQDKAYNQGMPPRIFKRVNEMFTVFKFKSSDFVYQTIVNNDIMNDDSIRTKLINMGNNIYLL